MKAVRGKETFELSRADLIQCAKEYAIITVDVGTGDGKFVYRLAQHHPDWFCIGIDPVQKNLLGSAIRIHRKPSRGGLVNALYAVACVEDLPQELNDLANRIYVNYPWGSLLSGVVHGDSAILSQLARISAPDATLEIRINYSLFAEPMSQEVRDLPDLTLEYIDLQLTRLYANTGLIIEGRRLIGKYDQQEVSTTWAKKLSHGKALNTIYLQVRIPK